MPKNDLTLSPAGLAALAKPEAAINGLCGPSGFAKKMGRQLPAARPPAHGPIVRSPA